MAAVAVPESIALSAVHTPAFAQLVLVGLPATAAYVLTLRLGFPAAWGETSGNVARILRLDDAAVRERALVVLRIGVGGLRLTVP